jgi:hypothetical protein
MRAMTTHIVCVGLLLNQQKSAEAGAGAKTEGVICDQQ